MITIRAKQAKVHLVYILDNRKIKDVTQRNVLF